MKEDYAMKLRQIAKALTGLDPNMGKAKKKVKKLADQEIENLFKGDKDKK